MNRTEFTAVAEEVFAELLPKVKAADRAEAITELINELQAQGLEIEEDDEDEDLGDFDSDEDSDGFR